MPLSEQFLNPPVGDTGLQAQPTTFQRLVQWLTERALGQSRESTTADNPLLGIMPTGPAELRMGKMPKAAAQNLQSTFDVLDQKVPGWRRLVQTPTRVAATPPADAMWGEMTIGGKMNNLLLHPEMLKPELRPQGAALTLHELMHPPVEDIPMPQLKTLANRASQELPLNERLRVGITHPDTSAGQEERLRELVTTWMEHNTARKRLGFQPGESTAFPSGTLPAPQGEGRPAGTFRPGLPREWVDELGNRTSDPQMMRQFDQAMKHQALGSGSEIPGDSPVRYGTNPSLIHIPLREPNFNMGWMDQPALSLKSLWYGMPRRGANELTPAQQELIDVARERDIWP